jgi:hypothetical protein
MVDLVRVGAQRVRAVYAGDVSRSWTRLLFPLLLALLAVAWCTQSKDRRTATAARGPTAPESVVPSGESYPLLDGLKPGDALGEWTVGRILVNESTEKKPQLAIELERKGSGITVWVARLENVSNPPTRTAKYGLTFGHARPYGEPIPEGAYEQNTNAIAERIRRTETTTPVPAGL